MCLYYLHLCSDANLVPKFGKLNNIFRIKCSSILLKDARWYRSIKGSNSKVQKAYCETHNNHRDCPDDCDIRVSNIL